MMCMDHAREALMRRREHERCDDVSTREGGCLDHFRTRDHRTALCPKKSSVNRNIADRP